MAPSVAAVGEMLFKINEQARVVANKEKGVLEKLFSEIEGSEGKKEEGFY